MKVEEYDERLDRIGREAIGASLGIAIAFLVLFVLDQTWIGDSVDKLVALIGVSVMLVASYFGATLFLKFVFASYSYYNEKEEDESDE